MKEKRPTISYQRIIEEMSKTVETRLSLKGIHQILFRSGLSRNNIMPFRTAETSEIMIGVEEARRLIKQRLKRQAAKVLNSLPGLSDFSILAEIPPAYLSLRRRVEQLEVRWGALPMNEMLERARALRYNCEKRRMFLTGAFAATIEMNAYNFLGRGSEVLKLYKKYRKLVPGLPLALKHTFLMECFIAYMFFPKCLDHKVFSYYPYRLARFCSRLPQGEQSASWLMAVSACYDLQGKVNKSLMWMEKLFEDIPPESKRDYLPEYLSLLATKGNYNAILPIRDSFSRMPTPLFLRSCLSQGNALLGTGMPNEALKIALDAFIKAEAEHLRNAMAGFTFFIASAYSALRETKKAKQYLKMSIRFSQNSPKAFNRCALLMGSVSPDAADINDAYIRLIVLYISACQTLKKTDYLRAYRFAIKEGLLGFLHRIMLLRPEAVVHLIKKGIDPRLPKEFVRLPVFKAETPIHRLLLLARNEAIFFDKLKMKISTRSKDFHVLVYLMLNRKKTLRKEDVSAIFYGHALNATISLNKALSRIRRHLNLPKGVLTSKRDSILLDLEVSNDLEEFEQRYKLGKILGKLGETQNALSEYRECFNILRKSPFERMGYYYNFAEERRALVRSMYASLCGVLLKDAEHRPESQYLTNLIKSRISKEGLNLSQ